MDRLTIGAGNSRCRKKIEYNSEHYAAFFDSTMLMWPQVKHRKVSTSENDTTFGLMRTSVIGISQTRHDAGTTSLPERYEVGRAISTAVCREAVLIFV